MVKYKMRNKQCVKKTIAIIIAGCAVIERSKKRRKLWMKDWLVKRYSGKGTLNLLHRELQVSDSVSFRNFIRMDQSAYLKLLNIVKERISKKDTFFRECISAEHRLSLTLRFLATGESFKSLMYSTRISIAAISKIIPEVCRVIYEELQPIYLKTPTTQVEWLRVSEEFEDQWNLPNVIGAIDGKHINFNAPSSSGSLYFNYKNTNSIVLLAVVDADYKFLYIDVGVNGRVSDGGVYSASDLCHALNNHNLNLPDERALPGRTLPVPYVIVGDAAFPLSKHIMKPYPFRGLTKEQRVFNYRLSRCRRVVENAFGQLASRFRIFLTTINLEPKKVKDITLACCALHNYLKTECESDRLIFDNSNTTDSNLTSYRIQHGYRSTNIAMSIRKEFTDYVNNEGIVVWQDRLI